MPLSKILLGSFMLLTTAVSPVSAYEGEASYGRDIRLPECDSFAVLGDIAAGFGHKERRFWDTGLSITGIEKIRETAWRPWSRNLIPRRFCTGIAIMSDGEKRAVTYSIRHRLGFLGMSWNVQWCVSGLDHNYGYGAECRAARP